MIESLGNYRESRLISCTIEGALYAFASTKRKGELKKKLTQYLETHTEAQKLEEEIIELVLE
jgi:hypothetical protein